MREAACGGEGGIRTHGAFAHRFSRAAPSTTRTPLRERGYRKRSLRPLMLTRYADSWRRANLLDGEPRAQQLFGVLAQDPAHHAERTAGPSMSRHVKHGTA